MKPDKKQNEFEQRLLELQQQWKQQHAQLLADGRDDEATLAKIRLNVIDIHEKMFAMCCSNVFVALKNPNLKAILNPSDDKATQMRQAYHTVCANITKPWAVHQKKAADAGDVTGAVIEENKLEMAQEIMTAFDDYFGVEDGTDGR